MKYCPKCGNPMDNDMRFCQKCGTPFPDAPASEQEVHDYDEYWGLSYFDIESGNKIELFPSGVRVSHDKGLPKYQFSQIIPYSSILEVRSVRASAVSSGYISIITATGGITEDVPRMQLLKDHNTVLFTRKTEPEVERIYRAIEDICDGSAFPSDTVEAAGRGTSSDGAVKYTPSLANAPKPKKKRGCLVPALVTCLLFVAFMVYVGKNVNPTGSNTSSSQAESHVEVLCDVTQFANITSQELTALLGAPDSTEAGTCSGSYDNIPCMYYEYDHEKTFGEVSFVLVNDRVVRFTSYQDYTMPEKSTLLTSFGIQKGDDCTVVNDTATALRYRCPSDTVNDLWLSLIGGDSFGFLQVTYSMLYFEEWYLPTSINERSSYQTKTQEAVKSILKSPKTADFPWTDWSFGKNPFYFAVQSYVDAQNSYGATVRSDFTFIYSVMTGDLVYAVFDNEVVADFGYVPTAELVAQLVADAATP